MLGFFVFSLGLAADHFEPPARYVSFSLSPLSLVAGSISEGSVSSLVLAISSMRRMIFSSSSFLFSVRRVINRTVWS